MQAPHLANDIKDFQLFTGSLLQRLPLLFHLHQEIVLGLDVQAQLFRLLQQLVAPLRNQQHRLDSEALLKTIPFSLIAYATDSAFIHIERGQIGQLLHHFAVYVLRDTATVNPIVLDLRVPHWAADPARIPLRLPNVELGKINKQSKVPSLVHWQYFGHMSLNHLDINETRCFCNAMYSNSTLNSICALQWSLGLTRVVSFVKPVWFVCSGDGLEPVGANWCKDDVMLSRARLNASASASTVSCSATVASACAVSISFCSCMSVILRAEERWGEHVNTEWMWHFQACGKGETLLLYNICSLTCLS